MKRKIAIVVLLAVTGLALPAIDDHLQAVAVMLQVMDPATKQALARYRQVAVREELLSLSNGIRARKYLPENRRAKRGLVVVHGVHSLGIEEPRLVAFARSLAGQGIPVLTPELPGIADFKVTPDSIEAIGMAAKEMRAGGEPVGVFGLSFSGGLALMAAADPRYREHVAFVVAVGAHHDMARVARFFALHEAPRPDGSVLRIKAHAYGALVLAYSYPQDFFPHAEPARSCLRAVLYEQKCDAATLPPRTREEMKHVFAHNAAHFRDRILANAARREADYAQVSPRGRLAAIAVPVLLLHGAADDVIPPSETEWLAQEIPARYREAVLITPAVSHVEIGGERDYAEDLRVVRFVARMIAAAED